MNTSTSIGKSQEAFKITAEWSEQSKALIAKYPQLTPGDLACETGKEAEMISRVEKRLAKKHDEVVNILRKAQAPKA